MKYRELTVEEQNVIVNKATEPPFSGEYVSHHADGMYTCKRCGLPLFRSSDKFDSHCGWPSFDDAIAGAVQRVPDPDGVRAEIVCARCKAHLGHVFMGEHMTDKDTRYCVNSISMQFSSERRELEHAYFAGGCFWGVEHLMRQAQGVVSAESGYMGGHVENPAYRQVCDGVTGHVETVHVVFDPSIVTYTELAKLFFEIHDPTQVGGQGPDLGEQYESVVFFTTDEQKRVINELTAELQAKGLMVATQLRPALAFWRGEEYHQDYFAKNRLGVQCHARVKRF